MENIDIEHSLDPFSQAKDVGLNGNSTNYSYARNLEPFKSTAKQSYIPFIFRSKRLFLEEINKQNSPPVGSYQVPSAFKKDKTGFQALQERNIFIRDWSKKSQMHMFKSSRPRFIENQSTTPNLTQYDSKLSMTSYSSKSKFTKKRSNANQKFRELVNWQNESFINQNRAVQICKSPFDIFQSCPSIPNVNAKFGYVHDKFGQAKIIKKSQKQLGKERQKCNNYNRSLKNQTFFNLSNSNTDNSFHQSIKQNKFNSNLIKTSYDKIRDQSYGSENEREKLASSRGLNQISLRKNNFNRNKIFNIKKPAQNQKNVANLSPKQMSQNKQVKTELGPGCYELDLDTIKPIYKRQKHQFFGSTQVRFRQCSDQKLNTNCEDSQFDIRSLPRDIPDYCTITSSFSKFNKSSKKKPVLSLKSRIMRQDKHQKNRLNISGLNQQNMNLPLAQKRAPKISNSVKQRKCYDQYKIWREKLRTQCRNKIKKINQAKNVDSKQFILKPANQVLTNKTKFRINFDEKTLKKKRFEHIYKSGIPQKPQTIKGVIISKNSSVQKSFKLTSKIKAIGSFSNIKIGHLRSKHNSNDFQLCSWEKEGNKVDQKLFGFRMKKVDTEELQSIHVSSRHQA